MALPLAFSIFFSFLFLLVLARLVKGASQAKNTNQKLPPGPYKLPFIGNIHNLISMQPHHKLRDLANKYGPLMLLQLGEVPTVVVSSPEIAREVMKTQDILFSDRPYVMVSRIFAYDASDIVFSPYGEYWRHLRKICVMELLSAKRVESFRAIREQEVAALVQTISSSEGSAINLSEMIYSLTYGITSRAAFGGRCKDQQTFISIAAETTKLASPFCFADMYPSSKLLQAVSGSGMKLERNHKRADRILEQILNDHREKRKLEKMVEEDLVDVLLRLQQHEFPLTDNNIKAVILDIFAAGSETSSTVVEWTMSELLKNPKLLQKAQTEVRHVFNSKGKVDESSIHEMEFLKSVVKETLRLHPPAPLLIPRECSKDCLINGCDIPSKTRVVINAWAIHRNPNYWNEPEKFDPERFLASSVDYKGANFAYIPFGAGRRMCPGILFAIPDIELPLAELLYHFDWKLANDMKPEELDMIEEFGLTVRRKNDLLLVPFLHRPWCA